MKGDLHAVPPNEREGQYQERFEAYLACERQGLVAATDQIAFELRMMQRVWGLSIVDVRLLESDLLYRAALKAVQDESSRREFLN